MSAAANISDVSDFQRNQQMLASALGYAGRGWRVFPLHTVGPNPTYGVVCTCPKFTRCEHPGKHPWNCKWGSDATISAKQIKAWWRAHPRANIAIATGAASQLFVLDVDAHSVDKGGRASLARLQERFGPLPKTLTARTGGGGLHHYFACAAVPFDLAHTLSAYPGLEWKWTGRYVVAPPSLHKSSRRYEWEDDSVKLAQAPTWLLEIAKKAVETPRLHIVPPRPSGGDQGAGERWLAHYLSQDLTDNRNNVGFALACQLRDSGLTRQDAEPVMLEYQARAPEGDEPYTVKEALASLHSAYAGKQRGPARPPSATQHAESTPDEFARHIETVTQANDVLLVPNYREDQAVRKAVLQPRTTWDVADDVSSAQPTKNMSVSLYDRDRYIPVEEAQDTLRRMRESTVVTSRIALAIWNDFRHHGLVRTMEMAYIPIEKILELRGFVRGADGSYKADDVESVLADFEIASRLRVKGVHYVARDNKFDTPYEVESQYINYAVKKSVGRDRLVKGVWCMPGGWQDSYRESNNYQLTPVDWRVLRLSPKTERHELRIALFLTERQFGIS